MKTKCFGNFLNWELEQTELSHAALGNLVGVERDVVKKWCDGEGYPNSVQVKRIEGILALTPGWLDKLIQKDRKNARRVFVSAKSLLIALVRKLPEERAALWLGIIRSAERGGSEIVQTKDKLTGRVWEGGDSMT